MIKRPSKRQERLELEERFRQLKAEQEIAQMQSDRTSGKMLFIFIKQFWFEFLCLSLVTIAIVIAAKALGGTL